MTQNTSASWEEEFDKMFPEDDVWGGERPAEFKWNKSKMDKIKDFISKQMEIARAEAEERGYQRGKKEAIEFISKNEGWEESEEYYKTKLRGYELGFKSGYDIGKDILKNNNNE